MTCSVACFLGAGYSYVAGVPLAKDLFRRSYVLELSAGSTRRFDALRGYYREWQAHHPEAHAEAFLGILYAQRAHSENPHWSWAVEYISAVIASAGTPPASLNRNPRYSNRINRPSGSAVHREFWNVLTNSRHPVSVVTTNYDILVERALRHKPMKRPPSPGCFYGGLARPQWLKGAAQPFSRWGPEQLIEMTGSVPVYKLHGSLSWALAGGAITAYQDLRPAFRNGGDAAIVPPLPEKEVPPWLEEVWRGAELALRQADIWVVCGYSMPAYDMAVQELLRRSGASRKVRVFLLSPDSDEILPRLGELVPEAEITPLPGLPDGTEGLRNALGEASMEAVTH